MADEKPKAAAPKLPSKARRAGIPALIPPYRPPAPEPESSKGTSGFVSADVRTGAVVRHGPTAPRPDDAPPAVAAHPHDLVRRMVPGFNAGAARPPVVAAPSSSKGGK